MGANDILLGKGVFSFLDVPIGLTRGGGQFVLEKEIRQIEADGDRGPVKGRIVQDKATPKLTINALEIINENLPKMYAAVKATKGEGKTIVTGTGKISDADYLTYVKFTGETKGGRQTVIKVENAINLENIDWSLVDKSEVIPALTFTGCYEEDSAADYEPWQIEYVDV